ncbi:APC family permease [Altererythrobacter sp. MF3-039]|uniref:APC family permease n=1 Tax=Altererythrobacter sp. MF3-039 TaxID=3252901 RepID=UPI00390C693E
MQRPFGLWTAASMVVGSMIGAGIFVLPSSLGQFGWTVAVGWVVAGAGVLVIARLIAELHVRYPKEPSALTISGDILGLLAVRLIAWSYWFGILVAATFLALAAADYLVFLFPDVRSDDGLKPVIATVILASLVIINLRGVKGAGKFQVATTALKLFPLAIVIAIVAYLAFAVPETYTASQSEPFRASLLTPALGATFFAVLGFEAASLVAQRVRDPERNVVRATLFGVLFVLIIYFLVSTGIVLATPADELHGASAPVAAFASTHAGSWAGNVVALFAVISAIGCLNAILLLLGEVPFGMARDGQLPDWVAPGSDSGVGRRPLIVAAVIAATVVLMSSNAFGAQVFDFLLRLTVAANIWFYAGICLAALKDGAKPILAVLGLAFCGWVLYGSGTEASIMGISLMLVGAILHFMIGGRTKPRGSAPA